MSVTPVVNPTIASMVLATWAQMQVCSDVIKFQSTPARSIWPHFLDWCSSATTARVYLQQRSISMGILDRLAGRDTRQQAPEPEEPAEPTTSGSSSEVLRDTAPTLGSFDTTQRLYDPYGEFLRPCECSAQAAPTAFVQFACSAAVLLPDRSPSCMMGFAACYTCRGYIKCAWRQKGGLSVARRAGVCFSRRSSSKTAGLE